MYEFVRHSKKNNKYMRGKGRKNKREGKKENKVMARKGKKKGGRKVKN